MSNVKAEPHAKRGRIDTRHLSKYAATAAVGMAAAGGAVLAAAPAAEAGGVHDMGCQGNTQAYCTYPTGHYLSYALIGTTVGVTSHQLCIHYTNSAGDTYGGCTSYGTSYDFYSTPPTRKKSVQGNTRLDESIYWRSAYVEYSS